MSLLILLLQYSGCSDAKGYYQHTCLFSLWLLQFINNKRSGLWLYFGSALNGNCVHNVIHNITLPNIYALAVPANTSFIRASTSTGHRQ